MRKKRRQ
jgi:hypothetical protein